MVQRLLYKHTTLHVLRTIRFLTLCIVYVFIMYASNAGLATSFSYCIIVNTPPDADCTP